MVGTMIEARKKAFWRWMFKLRHWRFARLLYRLCDRVPVSFGGQAPPNPCHGQFWLSKYEGRPQGRVWDGECWKLIPGEEPPS